MSYRRRNNAIRSVMVNDMLIEGVEPVRHAVFNHFAQHFKAQDGSRPSVSNLQFRSLFLVEGGGLIKPFSVEEVQEAVWNWDSFKSLAQMALILVL